ncbi:hypothetical protein [Cryptosporangium sp. NPDC051539]|uniref:hypothetical protein n=1 Tax=Cryptosporangium sp. NPDC051539 TaxID=3363962 RepID=UPI0037B23E0E
MSLFTRIRAQWATLRSRVGAAAEPLDLVLTDAAHTALAGTAQTDSASVGAAASAAAWAWAYAETRRYEERVAQKGVWFSRDEYQRIAEGFAREYDWRRSYYPDEFHPDEVTAAQEDAQEPTAADEAAWTEAEEWSRAGMPYDWEPVTESTAEQQFNQWAGSASSGVECTKAEADAAEAWADGYQEQMERLEVDDPARFDRIIEDSNRRLHEGAALSTQTDGQQRAADPVEAAEDAVTRLRHVAADARARAAVQAEQHAAEAYRDQQALWQATAAAPAADTRSTREDVR